MDQLPKDAPADLNPAMTVREVATYLNVNEKTVYRLAQRGDLPGFKVAGAWRFRRGDIEGWIDLQTRRGKAVQKRGSRRVQGHRMEAGE